MEAKSEIEARDRVKAREEIQLQTTPTLKSNLRPKHKPRFPTKPNLKLNPKPKPKPKPKLKLKSSPSSRPRGGDETSGLSLKQPQQGNGISENASHASRTNQGETRLHGKAVQDDVLAYLTIDDHPLTESVKNWLDSQDLRAIGWDGSIAPSNFPKELLFNVLKEADYDTQRKLTREQTAKLLSQGSRNSPSQGATNGVHQEERKSGVTTATSRPIEIEIEIETSSLDTKSIQSLPSVPGFALNSGLRNSPAAPTATLSTLGETSSLPAAPKVDSRGIPSGISKQQTRVSPPPRLPSEQNIEQRAVPPQQQQQQELKLKPPPGITRSQTSLGNPRGRMLLSHPQIWSWTDVRRRERKELNDPKKLAQELKAATAAKTAPGEATAGSTIATATGGSTLAPLKPTAQMLPLPSTPTPILATAPPPSAPTPTLTSTSRPTTPRVTAPPATTPTAAATAAPAARGAQGIGGSEAAAGRKDLTTSERSLQEILERHLSRTERIMKDDYRYWHKILDEAKTQDQDSYLVGELLGEDPSLTWTQEEIDAYRDFLPAISQYKMALEKLKQRIVELEVMTDKETVARKIRAAVSMEEKAKVKHQSFSSLVRASAEKYTNYRQLLLKLYDKAGGNKVCV